ncbi:MAG TPA: DUF521 domain-containing protein [Euryarchaeota archaeon]|nr:DUF521 domain-containing protein [Euryarchaeota archaeon]
MRLTDEEVSMLDGEKGPAMERAMEIVIGLARIYNAKNLVKITSANVSGVSYKNLTEHGIHFLNEWADMGAKVSVPTTLNPAGMDLLNWKEHNIPQVFAKKQREVIAAFERMGIPPTCTCTPYLINNLPKNGEHVAWGESSAVCYANSVLGARTNREGGPSALASAICGRTGNYGLHLDENRRAKLKVNVNCKLEDESQYGALGKMVAKEAGNDVIFFEGISPNESQLKALGASLAAWGGVAMFHVKGVTPESTMAHQNEMRELDIDSIKSACKAMNDPTGKVDMVSLGCPHASKEELEKIARLLDKKTVKTTLWVTTSRMVKDESKEAVNIIENAGGTVVADACVVVAPMTDLGFKHLATNSAKMAHYAPGHCKATVRFGSLVQCIEAAISGRWGP